jgi:glycosyltransferase involved in cell wall biosynthesis
MNSVLFIGPDHRDHRGGVGAVLDVYSKNITPFKFIPTYVTKSLPKQTAVYIAAIFKLIWVCITDRQIKILHIHHASKGSFFRKSILVLIGKFFGKKVIMHVHGAKFHVFYGKYKLRKPFIRYIIQKADVVVCLSEVWREFFSSNFKLKKLVIINNVIPKAVLTPQPKNGEAINLLFLGQIGIRKGLFDLLEVLVQNRKEFKNKVRLTIGGIGDVERLEKTLAESQFNGDVKFAGWVNGSKKAELLNSCDVYVLPSYFEGLPISILEAMSYGKPVISTDVGGIPEIVKPGYNGWLVKPGDKEALGNIIGEALENKELLKQYGSNSLSISENYTPESVFQSLNELYKQMLNNN